MTISNRLKSIKAWLGLLCLGFALFNSGCAEDKDAANDSSSIIDIMAAAADVMDVEKGRDRAE